MLERLNELSATIEQHSTDKRKAEAASAAAGARVRELEASHSSLQATLSATKRELETSSDKAKVAELEAECQELKDSLADAQDEADDLRSRESKQRVALLDELNSLQQEAASLRTQLRAEQRKKKG